MSQWLDLRTMKDQGRFSSWISNSDSKTTTKLIRGRVKLESRMGVYLHEVTAAVVFFSS